MLNSELYEGRENWNTIVALPCKPIPHLNARMNLLVWQFVELFKSYLKERRFGTIREYFLGIYRELSEQYARLPRNSELARFYEFMDRSFSRIQPIEELWKRYVRRRIAGPRLIYKHRPQSLATLKLFAEAGSADHAGRYLLNADAQAAIKPGTRLRIYPSYNYTDLHPKIG